MATLLKIDSSPRTTSVSNALTAKFAAEWQKKNPSGVVIAHNTNTENLPFIDETTLGAFFTPADQQTAEQKAKIAISDKLVDELLAADVLVIGLPMWNLGVPASFKAWVDLIVRAGRTFKYTETGVESLLPAGKKVYVITSRGGSYQPGTPLHPYDQQEPYVRTILAFLGLMDVTFIHAENQNREPEAAAAGLAKAETELSALFA